MQPINKVGDLLIAMDKVIKSISGNSPESVAAARMYVGTRVAKDATALANDGKGYFTKEYRDPIANLPEGGTMAITEVPFAIVTVQKKKGFSTPNGKKIVGFLEAQKTKTVNVKELLKYIDEHCTDNRAGAVSLSIVERE